MSNLPQVPERSMQPHNDSVRTPEESERRRLLHNSHQSTATTVPSILERPSEEISNPATPSRHAVTHWQPHSSVHLGETTAEPARLSQDARPPGPATYGRSTSNDYTVYEPSTATPSNANPPDTYAPNNGLGLRSDDAYFPRPYRRAGSASIRDTVETGSTKAGRYTPLANGHMPKKSVSLAPARTDGYDMPYSSDQEETPQLAPRPPQRRGTSIYFVQNGPDDGSGTPPPEFHLPFSSWLRGPIRKHFVAFLGELVGTTMFLFFAFAGTLVANIGAQESSNTTTNETVGFSPIVNLYVAVSFGFSLMVNVWIFFRVSGGLFNPAVTLGMVMTKTIDYVRGFLLAGAQLIGAIFASFLVKVLFPFDFNVRTTLAASTSVTRGVFIEAILTAELVFTVFMLAKEKHKSTYMAPVGIGLSMFVAELVGVFFTGGSLNPARSFGPCVVSREFDSEHWIYWLGPALGAVAAVAFYKFVKALEYESANPGQDHSAEDAEAASTKGKRDSRVMYGEKETV